MKVKEVSIGEYKKLHKDLSECRQMTSPMIDPIMRSITIIGKSGEGTSFKNEYERLMDEWLNPPLPVCIEMWEEDGCIRYVPRRRE